MIDLAPRNATLVEDLEPFVVATGPNLARFDLEPFGWSVAHQLDPLRMSSADFLEMLKRLDEVTFGPEGMPMPRWVFFDGAELPGGIVGLGKRAKDLADDVRSLLRVPREYKGLVPYSMFIAIPTFEPGVWMAHNLAALTALVPEESLKGLGGLTKAVGLKVFRATRQLGATQWDTEALFVHTRLGPLELLSAWTPAHAEPWTLTYAVDVSDSVLRHLARDDRGEVQYREPELYVKSDDREGMRALQLRIEAGESFVIANRPERDADGVQRIPVAKV